jgi:hypothetical protein
MAGVIIIVSRDRPELYEYLRQAFSGIETVRVTMDRRLSVSDDPEARGASEVPARRSEPDIYDELLLRGFVIRRVP